MQAYSIEKVIAPDGKLLLDTLPFLAGETVQVIILPSKSLKKVHRSALLKGSVVEYSDPLEPVVQDDWAALQSVCAVSSVAQSN